MKKGLWLTLFLITGLIIGSIWYLDKTAENDRVVPAGVDPIVGMANPASKYCLDNGGQVEIVTEVDGSQFGLCQLADYACEEWAYFRQECQIEADAKKIETELIGKGLNLQGMKVVIKKHLGKYIEAGVVPMNAVAVGGYVFAVKNESGSITVLADGNGTIGCAAFEDYPDFSTYLVPECVDEITNEVVVRSKSTD